MNSSHATTAPGFAIPCGSQVVHKAKPDGLHEFSTGKKEGNSSRRDRFCPPSPAKLEEDSSRLLEEDRMNHGDAREGS